MSKARLVWATPGGDDLIAKMARVSNPSNENNTETAPKLIRYLISNKHWSPFQMVNLCVEVETTRSISAQILRHSSFSFQEFSQRYAESSIADIPEFRRQDLKNRQNSIDDLSDETLREAEEIAGSVIIKSYRAYKELLDLGIAKECARELLPMCTPTRLYINGNVRSWIHYLQLRTDPSTQKEHRDVAQQIMDVFIDEFPNTSRAVGFLPS